MKTYEKVVENPIRSRLHALMEYNGFNENSFIRYCGLSKSWWNVTGTPSGESIGRIKEKFPDLSLEWLFTGSGTMLLTQAQHLKPAPKPYTSEVNEPTPEYRRTQQPTQQLPTITIPLDVYHTLQQQIATKDATIASLLALLNNPQK